MKKIQIFFVLSICFLILFSTQTFAQNKAACQAKLDKLKSAGDKIEPKSKEHVELARICDSTEIPDELKEKSDWQKIGEALDEMIKIVNDVKNTDSCDSSVCKSLREYKKEIDKLGKVD